MRSETPLPSLVPTSQGGIQAEWHQEGIDLEIEATSSHRFAVYLEDVESGKSEELITMYDFDSLELAMERITPI